MPPLLLYFIAITSLSMAANLIRIADAPPLIIGFWRLLFASLLLLPFALTRGKFLYEFKAKKKDFIFVVISAVFFFLHLWTYFFAAQNTKIANCMIIFSTNPLFVALCSYLIFKEKFTWRLVFAYVLAMFGIFYLLKNSLSLEKGLVLGDLSAFISAIFFAGYLISGKKARLSLANTNYTFLTYFLASLLFGIVAYSQDNSFLDYPKITWYAILGTVIFPTLLGHVLFSYLMTKMNLNLMSCGKLIEPVLASLVAFFIFQESLSQNTYIAFAFTSSAILILFISPKLFMKSKQLD